MFHITAPLSLTELCTLNSKQFVYLINPIKHTEKDAILYDIVINNGCRTFIFYLFEQRKFVPIEINIVSPFENQIHYNFLFVAKKVILSNEILEQHWTLQQLSLRYYCHYLRKCYKIQMTSFLKKNHIVAVNTESRFSYQYKADNFSVRQLNTNASIHHFVRIFWDYQRSKQILIGDVASIIVKYLKLLPIVVNPVKSISSNESNPKTETIVVSSAIQQYRSDIISKSFACKMYLNRSVEHDARIRFKIGIFNQKVIKANKYLLHMGPHFLQQNVFNCTNKFLHSIINANQPIETVTSNTNQQYDCHYLDYINNELFVLSHIKEQQTRISSTLCKQFNGILDFEDQAGVLYIRLDNMFYSKQDYKLQFFFAQKHNHRIHQTLIYSKIITVDENKASVLALSYEYCTSNVHNIEKPLKVHLERVL